MSPHCLRIWRCASTGSTIAAPGWVRLREWRGGATVRGGVGGPWSRRHGTNYGRKKQCEVRDEVFHGPPNFVLDVFDDDADENYLRRRDRFSRYGVRAKYVAYPE